LKIEAGQEIGEKTYQIDIGAVTDFIAARNVSFNVNDVMKTAEEKLLSSVCKEEGHAAAQAVSRRACQRGGPVSLPSQSMWNL
jgi:hypothetical protein